MFYHILSLLHSLFSSRISSSIINKQYIVWSYYYLNVLLDTKKLQFYTVVFNRTLTLITFR